MKTFLTIKTLISKSRKICIFPKGLIHGFCQKLRFSRLFLEKMDLENAFGKVLEREPF